LNKKNNPILVVFNVPGRISTGIVQDKTKKKKKKKKEEKKEKKKESLFADRVFLFVSTVHFLLAWF
jgi:hypothetical protein